MRRVVFLQGLLLPNLFAAMLAGACSGSPSSTPTSPSTLAPTLPAAPPPTSQRPPTWDPATQGIPRFVSRQYLDLDAIRRISRFRSSEGHSYTDDFEQCRSMKHYFEPRSYADSAGIRIYAPVDGEVSDAFQEWAGWQIHITAAAYPAFRVILFHVNTTSALTRGTRLAAGEAIGTHVGSQTMSDVAVGVSTPSGFALISWFDVLDDAAFEAYRTRGLASRADAVISRTERDSQPLGCSGEAFNGKGSLENWITLR